ncbi:MAG: transcriptional regulator with XRE-family HTH domain [Rickettsiales bacterium]|jgi:transcriptional regulator with XRE-family HTH domain
MQKNFGQKIKERRKELKITLEELGNKIDSTKAYVWELENKSNARPSADKLLKIADALQVSPDYLINNDLSEQDDESEDIAFFRKFKKLSDNDKQILKSFITSRPSEDDKK